MKKIFLQAVLSILPFYSLKAQIPLKEINVKDFYTDEIFSLSSRSIEEAGQAYFGNIEVTGYTMIASTAEIQNAVKLIFDPVLKESSQLLDQAEKRRSLSPQQREWMQRYQQVFISGVSDVETAVANFLYERESIASGKLYWCSISTPLSEAGKKILQEILILEKQLDFKAYREQTKQLGKTFGRQSDKISVDFSNEIANVPMKNIDAGMGAAVEIPDPQKQADLIRKYEQLQLKEFQSQYDQYMKNWKINIPVFIKAADNVTKLLERTGYGNNLTGVDRQLIPYLADLQCRTIETSSAIREIAGKITETATMAQTVKETNQRSLSLLEPYIK